MNTTTSTFTGTAPAYHFGALPVPSSALPSALLAEDDRAHSLQVLKYTPVGPSAKVPLAPPGTVTVIFTPPGSSLIENIADAVCAGQGGEIVITKSLFGDLASRTTIPFEDATTLRDQNSVLSDISYGRKTLLENLFIPPGSTFGLAFLPYNGARLAPEAFSLHHHSRVSAGEGESNTPPLKALILISEPPLTPAESAALSAIGSDDADMLIGSTKLSLCAAFVAAVVAYAVVVAVVAVTSLHKHAAGDIVHLTDEEVRTLGPHATAGELIARRHALLLSSVN
jgi:hypothetical protein